VSKPRTWQRTKPPAPAVTTRSPPAQGPPGSMVAFPLGLERGGLSALEGTGAAARAPRAAVLPSPGASGLGMEGRALTQARPVLSPRRAGRAAAAEAAEEKDVADEEEEEVSGEGFELPGAAARPRSVRWVKRTPTAGLLCGCLLLDLFRFVLVSRTEATRPQTKAVPSELALRTRSPLVFASRSTRNVARAVTASRGDSWPHKCVNSNPSFPSKR